MVNSELSSPSPNMTHSRPTMSGTNSGHSAHPWNQWRRTMEGSRKPFRRHGTWPLSRESPTSPLNYVYTAMNRTWSWSLTLRPDNGYRLLIPFYAPRTLGRLPPRHEPGRIGGNGSGADTQISCLGDGSAASPPACDWLKQGASLLCCRPMASH
jgi:hypothetical protein